MARKTSNAQPATTAQRLGTIIKTARDIMRKDKGLNGDLDRLPMLTWVMFLKFLDDIEQMREQKAALKRERFRPAIEPPYRWRDWATREDGITGPELIAFVNHEEAARPDSTRGPGLLAYLRGLAGAGADDSRDADRVDVILTNPPFGGEEEKGILSNFPEDMQTTETALMFLQLIMRKLRKTPTPGRAGVVVPNGMLFGDGVCGRIKQELLKEFNLHTVVRLPSGVFAPDTPIPTNLLFFDRLGPTREIWYYDVPLPEGRRQFTKTQPFQYEEFANCLAWWKNREENERAWKVSAEDIVARNYNLDLKNPKAAEDIEHLPPEQLADDILQKELRIAEIMGEIKALLGRGT